MLDPAPYFSAKISFIVPAFNYAHFLPECINSIIRQRLDNYEIVIVDDGSTDNTRDVVRNLKGNIKYIYQKNQGLSSARNLGILNSNGKYIQFIDADDILGNNIIRHQLANMQSRNNCHMTVCRNRTFFDVDSKGFPKPHGTWRLFRKNLDVHLCYFNIAPPVSFLLTRALVDDVGLFDTTLAVAEDYDYWFRALTRDYVPSFNPRGFVYYRKHKHSLSTNMTRQHTHDAIVQYKVYDFIKHHYSFPINHRIDGLFAFTAGAILTSCRLKKHGIQEHASIINYALNTLHAAISEYSTHTDLSTTTFLYYFRILHTINEFSRILGTKYVLFEKLMRDFKDTMLANKNSSSVVRLYLSEILNNNERDMVELWRTLNVLYRLVQTKVHQH